MDATAAVMEASYVYSPKLTHSGHHAGVSEAYERGLSLDDIRHLGQWVMGQMENFYAPKNPTRGAFCMAHFSPHEPYFLECDLVMPPLDLQCLIFPWIKSTFDIDMPEKAATWCLECDKEMGGVDPNVATDEDIFWNQPDRTTLTKRLSCAFVADALIAQIGFLKLLVQLWHIILQDAVLFLMPNENGMSLSNALLEALPGIFKCRMFVAFQHDLLSTINEHH